MRARTSTMFSSHMILTSHMREIDMEVAKKSPAPKRPEDTMILVIGPSWAAKRTIQNSRLRKLQVLCAGRGSSAEDLHHT